MLLHFLNFCLCNLNVIITLFNIKTFEHEKGIIVYFTEVGQHFYWSVAGFQVHGQVLLNSWFVILVIVVVGILTTRELKLIPDGNQSFIEFITEFIRDISKTQIGEKEYLKWVPYLGTSAICSYVS